MGDSFLAVFATQYSVLNLNSNRRGDWHWAFRRISGTYYDYQNLPSSTLTMSQDALYHGGPLGALLGYSVIGSAVYCLCVSIGEIIAFLYALC